MHTVSTPGLLPDPTRPHVADSVRGGRDYGFAAGVEILRPLQPGLRRGASAGYDYDETEQAAADPRAARPAAPPPTSVWERIAIGPWQAPAALAFAAQRYAQEEMSPGLHVEDFPPAIRAYARAMGDLPLRAPAGRDTGLPLWV